MNQLEKRFGEAAPVQSQYATSYFDEVAALIRERGPEGLSFLLQQVGTPDVNRRRAVVTALAFPGLRGAVRHRVLDVLREFLSDSDAVVVQDAVDGLALLRDQSAFDQVLSLRDHQSGRVRASVLRYLAMVAPEEAPAALIGALVDPDPIVRRTAIAELDELDVVPALYQIRRLISDPDAGVREAAETAVSNLEELQHQRSMPLNGAVEVSEQEGDSPAEFERFCRATLQSSGYSSIRAEPLSIPGLDLLARDPQQQLVAIHCKWTNKAGGRIGESPVIALRASTDAVRAERGILMTNGRVSRAASVLAWTTLIEVVDRTISSGNSLREGWRQYLSSKVVTPALSGPRPPAAKTHSVVVRLAGLTSSREWVSAIFDLIRYDRVVEYETQPGAHPYIRKQLDALAAQHGFRLIWASAGRNRTVVYRDLKVPS